MGWPMENIELLCNGEGIPEMSARYKRFGWKDEKLLLRSRKRQKSIMVINYKRHNMPKADQRVKVLNVRERM